VVGFSPAAMAMPSRMLLSLGCVVIGKTLEVGMKFLREDLSSIYKSINSRKSEFCIENKWQGIFQIMSLFLTPSGLVKEVVLDKI
jgi:hypothetical protein